MDRRRQKPARRGAHLVGPVTGDTGSNSRKWRPVTGDTGSNSRQWWPETGKGSKKLWIDPKDKKHNQNQFLNFSLPQSGVL